MDFDPEKKSKFSRRKLLKPGTRRGPSKDHREIVNEEEASKSIERDY